MAAARIASFNDLPRLIAAGTIAPLDMRLATHLFGIPIGKVQALLIEGAEDVLFVKGPGGRITAAPVHSAQTNIPDCRRRARTGDGRY